MRIVVLGLDGTLPSGITGLGDVFWLANEAIKQNAVTATAPSGVPIDFELLTASPRGHAIRDGRGGRLPVDVALPDVVDCDAILVPGVVQTGKGPAWSSTAMRETGAWIRKQHAHGAITAGACGGVFMLGEAGLLHGRRCTTTWWLHDELRRRYPRAHAIWGSSLIDDGRVVTSGGPLSWIDSALHVIRALAGPEAARLAADFAVIDNAPSAQTIYMPRGFLKEHDPFLVEAERAVRHLAYDVTVAELASRLSTSERTLHRRLKQLTQESPKAFIARIKLEAARTLLEDNTVSIKRIAQQMGYADESSFRRAFARFAGMTPSAYRSWARKR